MKITHNIDFDFIHKLEGFSLSGYVPDPDTSQSGVTIASGFDIGQCSREEIEKSFSTNLAKKLIPYTRLIKADACEVLKDRPLNISPDEAREVTEIVQAKAIERICHSWDNSKAKTAFAELPTAIATVITSVAFQYGNLAKRTPNFWRQVTAEDWPLAIANLKNFGDKYTSRRHQEAELLESWLKEKETI